MNLNELEFLFIFWFLFFGNFLRVYFCFFFRFLFLIFFVNFLVYINMWKSIIYLRWKFIDFCFVLDFFEWNLLFLNIYCDGFRIFLYDLYVYV